MEFICWRDKEGEKENFMRLYDLGLKSEKIE